MKKKIISIRKYLLNYLMEALLILMSLTVLIPYLMVLLGSFKDLAGASVMTLDLPEKCHIVENYTEAFTRGNIFSGFKNSIINTTLVVVSTVLITSLAAYIIQRRNDRATKIIYGILLSGIIMQTNIVTLVFLIKNLHLNNIAGLILAQIAGNISFCTVLYVSYIKGIPAEIDESARIEGCGPVRLFYQIIFPLLKPMTATLVIFVAMGIWNDFKTPLYLLNDSKLYTISLSLFYFIGEAGNTRWNLIYAVIVIVSLPIITLYLFMQKRIIAGLTTGAVKG